MLLLFDRVFGEKATVKVVVLENAIMASMLAKA